MVSPIVRRGSGRARGYRGGGSARMNQEGPVPLTHVEDPEIHTRKVAVALRTAWAVEASALTFMPGYDMRAASYAVATTHARAFLKVHFGPRADAPLEVPRTLLEAGVPNVLAPMRTLASGLRLSSVRPTSDGRRAPAGLPVGPWPTTSD